MARAVMSTLVLGAWLVVATSAQLVPVSPDAELRVACDTSSGTTTIALDVVDAAGVAFLLDATAGPQVPDGDTPWARLGPFALDADGEAHLVFGVDTAVLAGLPPVHLRALFLDQAAVLVTPTVSTTLQASDGGDEEPQGELLLFDWGLGGVALPAGTIASTAQPWATFMDLSADNAHPSHPDAAILFDSSNPTGNDPDLGTPGTGLFNDTPLGKLLVIACDVVDSEPDGLVDDPDDEAQGGVLVFDFFGPANIGHLTLVDIDENEPGGEVRFLKDGDLLWTAPLQALGDNSVQQVTGFRDVTRMEIELPGSGGLGPLQIYPCETVLNMDESSTGVPLGLEAGDELSPIDDPFADLGVYFTASNGGQGPHKAVIFDSSAADAGELATPGSGIGNASPLRNLLVVEGLDPGGPGPAGNPTPEPDGGVLILDWFTSCGTFRGATVVDVDEDESAYIVVFLNAIGDPSVIVPLVSLGDSSVQTVNAIVGPTRRVEFHFSGTAALAEVRFCPDFD